MGAKSVSFFTLFQIELTVLGKTKKKLQLNLETRLGGPSIEIPVHNITGA